MQEVIMQGSRPVCVCAGAETAMPPLFVTPVIFRWTAILSDACSGVGQATELAAICIPHDLDGPWILDAPGWVRLHSSVCCGQQMPHETDCAETTAVDETEEDDQERFLLTPKDFAFECTMHGRL